MLTPATFHPGFAPAGGHGLVCSSYTWYVWFHVDVNVQALGVYEYRGVTLWLAALASSLKVGAAVQGHLNFVFCGALQRAIATFTKELRMFYVISQLAHFSI